MDKNSKRLKQILEIQADPWKDLAQFRELLQDYFPDDKISRNLLYISAEERIPQRLQRSKECEEEEIDYQKQRLMDASGCTKRNADKILDMWIQVFDILVLPERHEALKGIPLLDPGEEEPAWYGEGDEMGEDEPEVEAWTGECEGDGDEEDGPIYTEFDHPGRDVCDLLRDVRKKIAEKNDIKYEFEECHHTGPCKGTCPACEAELRYLEAELKKKIDRGEEVFIEGLASKELEEYLKKDKHKERQDLHTIQGIVVE